MSIDPQATHLAVFAEIKQLKAELADVEQMNHSLQRRIMDLESEGVVVEIGFVQAAAINAALRGSEGIAPGTYRFARIPDGTA